MFRSLKLSGNPCLVYITSHSIVLVALHGFQKMVVTNGIIRSRKLVRAGLLDENGRIPLFILITSVHRAPTFVILLRISIGVSFSLVGISHSLCPCAYEVSCTAVLSTETVVFADTFVFCRGQRAGAFCSFLYVSLSKLWNYSWGLRLVFLLDIARVVYCY